MQAASHAPTATDTIRAGSVRLRSHWAESDCGGSPFQTRRYLYDAFKNLSLIAFLALIAWRLVFTGLRRRPLVRRIVVRQQRRNNLFEEGLNISGLERVAINVGYDFENSSGGLNPLDQKDRAKAYLRRIVALTDATQMGDEYVLDVGTIRFHVRDRYVRRLRDAADPKCGYEETCFYPVHKGMPKAEEIATALLQLANNPALFDKWAVQNGQAFKADGQVFSRAQ